MEEIKSPQPAQTPSASSLNKIRDDWEIQGIVSPYYYQETPPNGRGLNDHTRSKLWKLGWIYQGGSNPTKLACCVLINWGTTSTNQGVDCVGYFTQVLIILMCL